MTLVIDNPYRYRCEFSVTDAHNILYWHEYLRSDDLDEAYDHWVSPDCPSIVEWTLTRIFDAHTNLSIYAGLMYKGAVQGLGRIPAGAPIDPLNWPLAWQRLETVDELIPFAHAANIPQFKINSVIIECIKLCYSWCGQKSQYLELSFNNLKFIDLSHKEMREIRRADLSFYQIICHFIDSNRPYAVSRALQSYAYNLGTMNDFKQIRLVRDRITLRDLLLANLQPPRRMHSV